MNDNMDRKRASTAHLTPHHESSYRDDPDAVSMHTTRSDYEYDDFPDLPTYNDAVSGATLSPPNNNVRLRTLEPGYRTIPQPSLPAFGTKQQERARCSPSVKIGSETSIRMDAKLMDADHLYGYIHNYLRVVPPSPMVRIKGYHMRRKRNHEGKKEKERVTDFDIVLSLQHWLRKSGEDDPTWWDPRTVDGGTKAHRGSFRSTRAEGYTQDIEVGQQQQERDLQSWCEHFCSNKSALRVFRIQRNVMGLDTEYIKSQLEPAIRATHYRGHVDISFPIADRNVDIYSPHWVNSARITWVRWLFYLSFLWLITWPILFFTTKWWTVYNVDWYFSVPTITTPGSTSRSYATISELQWVEKYEKLVQKLVLEKFQGDGITVSQNVGEVDLDRRRNEIRVPDVRLGGGGIGAAFSVLQAGTSVWNQANGRGETGWGMDEY